MNRGPKELSIKHDVLAKMWEYLRDNFHKFSDHNKIKVALALSVKDLPQEIQGNINHVVDMPVIKIGIKPLEYNIGNIQEDLVGNN
jgi:hypothetical protein